MRVENGRVTPKISGMFNQVLLEVEQDGGDCPYLHDLILTAEQAEDLANELLSLAQDIRNK